MDGFVEKLFTAKSFDHDYTLITNVDGAGAALTMPESVRREQFVDWVDKSVPMLQSPTWLGLPLNAEKVLLTNRGEFVLLKFIF